MKLTDATVVSHLVQVNAKKAFRRPACPGEPWGAPGHS
jgi:hypothetical protein